MQVAALTLGASPAALNAGPRSGGKPEAPSVDRFAAVRSALADSVEPGLKDALFVAVQNDVGVLLARGPGEPVTAAPDGLDLAGVGQAGAAGALRSVEGAQYFLVAVPMFVSDKNEVRAAGFAVVGLPLVPDAKLFDEVKQALGLEGVALLAQGKALAAAGDKAGLETLAGTLKAGTTAPVGSGPVRELGPLALPLFVDSPTHALGRLHPVPGTGLEVVAVASARASLDALAGYQVFGLGALVGLALLAVAVLVVLGGGEEQGAAMVMPPPVAVPQVAAPQRRDDSLTPAPLSMREPEPAPEASPDDFDFPASSPSSFGSSPSSFPSSSPASFSPPPPPVATGQNQAFDPGEEPMSDPFAQAAPPPPPVGTSESPAYQPGLNDELDEGQRTVNYPVYKGSPSAPPPPSADPFAMAAAQMGEEGLVGGDDDNPESTRVAAVPQELIRAARAGATGSTAERPALKTGNIPKIGSVPPAGDDDRHFQDVFRDFVATREKCGEAADGLTFEKFRAKLLKNKEQLVAKYACRTVRFQVYVKDGKAALKATPVKD